MNHVHAHTREHTQSHSHGDSKGPQRSHPVPAPKPKSHHHHTQRAKTSPVVPDPDLPAANTSALLERDCDTASGLQKNHSRAQFDDRAQEIIHYQQKQGVPDLSITEPQHDNAFPQPMPIPHEPCPISLLHPMMSGSWRAHAAMERTKQRSS